jgi:hypothetical protein
MSDAIIIPFPARAPAHQVDGRPSRPLPGDDRLAEALDGLQNALAEQAQAVRAWRFAMAELGIGVAGLGQTMAAYDTSLSQLDAQLLGLRQNADALAVTADRALLS